jgi:enoyl-CoA hydratase
MSDPSEPPVLISRDGALGRLTLNRPAALHALNAAMVQLMSEALLAWRTDPSVGAVLIDHTGGRGFCAGGDVRMLAASGQGDGVEARAFFHAEYRLNHLLHSYPKPVVALMDGITMGGGVGISVHGAVRIATERTVFAMPETGIGLFPDVGGGWFLPRLPGETGTWLALTGARLKAADCRAAGIATHFVPTELLGAVKAQIAGAAQAHDPAAALASGLDALDEPAGQVQELTGEARGRIDRCFAADTVEDIIAALTDDGSDWAQAQAAILADKSPQTLKVALRQLRAGRAMHSFASVMAMEYRIGARVIHRPDFAEGVRAVLIDKDNHPHWLPPTLQAVPDSLIDSIFAPLPAHLEWTPFPDLSDPV